MASSLSSGSPRPLVPDSWGTGDLQSPTGVVGGTCSSSAQVGPGSHPRVEEEDRREGAGQSRVTLPCVPVLSHSCWEGAPLPAPIPGFSGGAGKPRKGSPGWCCIASPPLHVSLAAAWLPACLPPRGLWSLTLVRFSCGKQVKGLRAFRSGVLPS